MRVTALHGQLSPLYKPPDLRLLNSPRPSIWPIPLAHNISSRLPWSRQLYSWAGYHLYSLVIIMIYVILGCIYPNVVPITVRAVYSFSSVDHPMLPLMVSDRDVVGAEVLLPSRQATENERWMFWLCAHRWHSNLRWDVG